MSWEATTAVIAKSKQKGGGLLMMIVLANYADKFGYAWPSIKTLARDTRLSDRNIQYLARRAAAIGELDVFANQGVVNPKTGQRTNLFRVTFCENPPPGHPYFELVKGRKNCTASPVGQVVQNPAKGVQSLHPSSGQVVQTSVARWCKPASKNRSGHYRSEKEIYQRSEIRRARARAGR
jgi:hypothetical protein